VTWTNIANATSSTYLVVSADTGAYLRVVVTATNGSGSTPAISPPVGPIVSGAPVVTGAPMISGTLRVGQTLSATSGSWRPAATSYTYQWQRYTNPAAGWTNVSGATGTTDALVGADSGAALRVLVTASNSFGSATASSPVVGPIASGAPADVAAPVITGLDRVGQTLTVSSGSWNPAATSVASQWQRSTNRGATWTNIGGANRAAYITTSSDTGAYLRASVTATNIYGSTTTTSPVIGPIASTAVSSGEIPASGDSRVASPAESRASQHARRSRSHRRKG
jgi:hypothetical protein